MGIPMFITRVFGSKHQAIAVITPQAIGKEEETAGYGCLDIGVIIKSI
jgi:hypothetical protein